MCKSIWVGVRVGIFSVFVALFAEVAVAAANNLELLYTADKLGTVFKAYRPGYDGITHPILLAAQGFPSGGPTTSAQKIDKWNIYSVFNSPDSGEQHLKAHVDQGLFDPVMVSGNPLPGLVRDLLKVADAGVSLERAITAAGTLPGPIVEVKLMWPIPMGPGWPYNEFVYFLVTQPPDVPTTKTLAICTGVTETGSSGVVKKC